ncbi:hypothetical protein FRX31_004440, partial [Thalictrum thalictroides]
FKFNSSIGSLKLYKVNPYGYQTIPTTPLQLVTPRITLYYVNLTGISVGNVLVPVSPAFDMKTGAGTILDTNTHFEEFPNLEESLKDVCLLVSEADAIVEEEINAFFPPYPHHITQEQWLGFKRWLKSDMGWPIRSLCKPWYEHVRHSQIVCFYCRGGVVIDVDSGSDISADEDEDGLVEGIAAGDETDGDSDATEE